MLQNMGFEVEVAAFDRDYHRGTLPNCRIENLGFVQQGHYFKRIFKLIRALPIIRKRIRKNQVAFVTGLDMAALVLLAGIGTKIRVAVEIADIRRIQVGQGLIGRIVRFFDRCVVTRCELIVITASGFESWYYNEIIGIEHHFFLLENKLDPGIAAEIKSKLAAVSGYAHSGKLRIGYFGILRCRWSVRALMALAEAYPDAVEIKIAGYASGTSELIREAECLPNVSYHGSYNSPDDLPSVYADVDLVWACYPGEVINDNLWQKAQLICRSNRFYESCCFETPIITLKGSGDSQEVCRHDIGCLIDSHDTHRVIELLMNIERGDIERWKSNLCELPRGVYAYGEERITLKQTIWDISSD